MLFRLYPMTELLLIPTNYTSCKIFILLFLSFLILTCNNNQNTTATNTKDIVIGSLERATSIKEGETFRFVLELNETSIKDVSFDWYV